MATNPSTNIVSSGSFCQTVTAGGTAGQFVTIANMNTSPPMVEITGGDIIISGASLKDFMCAVHDRLAILQPNPDLEKEFNELAICAAQYRELEKKFLEQQKILKILNR